MNIDQLKYVQVVAKYASFSKASEVLYVSQSAISQAINRIEKELNLTIFNRTTKQVNITKEGELALKLIETILNTSDKLLNLNKNIKNVGEINLAIVKGLFLPFMLEILRNEIEDTRVRFSEDDSLAIIDGIQTGIVDIGIIPIYEENEHILKSLRVSPIIDISYYVFVSAQSTLATKRTLNLQDIVHEQIILYDGAFLKWTFKSLTAENPQIDLLFSSTNQEFIREFTSKNQGITIDTIAEIIVNPHVHSGEVIAIPLEFNLASNHYLGMVANLSQIDQVLYNKLFQLIAQYVKAEIKKVHSI